MKAGPRKAAPKEAGWMLAQHSSLSSISPPAPNRGNFGVTKLESKPISAMYISKSGWAEASDFCLYFQEPQQAPRLLLAPKKGEDIFPPIPIMMKVEIFYNFRKEEA